MQNILVGFRIQLFQAQPCGIKPVSEPDIAITQSSRAILRFPHHGIWHQHRRIAAVIGRLRTLHRWHLIPIPDSRRIVLRHGSSRIPDIICHTGLLGNGTVTVHRRNRRPAILSFTQIVWNRSRCAVIIRIIVVLGWPVCRLGQCCIIPLCRMFRFSIPKPVNFQAVWIDFKISPVTMCLEHTRLFQETDLITLFQLRRRKGSLVLVERIQNPRRCLSSLLILINCRKLNFLWPVRLVMPVLPVFQFRILWLLLHYHIGAIWKHGRNSIIFRNFPIGLVRYICR